MKKYFLALFVLLLFFFNNIYSQCAGNDNMIIICDVTDTSNSSFDLFSNLGGSPSSGGNWVNNQNLPIFIGPSSNGIVNLWDITIGGTYSFTYTVNSPNCTNNQATLTIVLGGYAGEDNFSANACEDDDAVNLFQFIGSDPNPHFFGTWSDISNTGALSGSIFDATVNGPGTYTFTYTVNSIATCTAKTSTVELTVHPLPNSGASDVIEICGIDDLANYTTVNLADVLVGEDPNGIWTENGSSQINGPNDTIINIQNLFANSGYGEYPFSYTVQPDHPICTSRTSTITVIIRRIIDFTGTTLSIDSVCENDLPNHNFQVNFNDLPNIDNVPFYDYEITYDIIGPVPTTGSASITRNNPFFSLDSSFAPSPGIYTLNITGISVEDPEDSDLICDIIWGLTTTFEVFENPNLEGTTINIANICLGENNTASLTNIPVPDGNYTLTCTLNGVNSTTPTDINLTISNGATSFTIDSSALQNSGTTILTITNISNGICETASDLSKNFEVFPLPDTSLYNLTIDDVCVGENSTATISNITNLNQVNITYTINGPENVTAQTINLTINNTTGSFSLPNLNQPGVYNVSIIEIENPVTGCSVNTSINKDFSVYAPPNPPQIISPQVFCKVENASIADVIPAPSNNILWFDNANSTNELPANTLLSTQTYYVVSINQNGCLSSKQAVEIIIKQVQALSLVQDGALFCGADNPTLAQLTENITAAPNISIEWYTANGELLDENTPLEDNVTYFAFAIDTTTNCESTSGFEVQVSLTDCETENPEEDYDFFIPDAFSPNNDGLNDSFRIKNIEFIYPNYEFDIYNRYGKRLFTGNIQNPEWNGRTNNTSERIAPNGVYFYVIKFNKNNKAPKQGRLYLNR